MLSDTIMKALRGVVIIGYQNAMEKFRVIIREPKHYLPPSSRFAQEAHLPYPPCH